MALENSGWVGQDILGGIPSIILGSFITLLIYLARKRGETKALVRKFAESVRHEIGRVQELLDNTTRTAIRIRPFATVDRLPTDIYDGLLNSAAISNLDIGLQEGLYDFYSHFRGKPVDEILVSEETLSTEAVKIADVLDRYIHRKKPWLRFF